MIFFHWEKLSSEMVVKAYVERIKEVNPLLNAVIEDRFEAAVNDAKIYDERLKSGEVTALQLETERPLYGVPVTIKESCSVKGNMLLIKRQPSMGLNLGTNPSDN